jgi:hypothetical protein
MAHNAWKSSGTIPSLDKLECCSIHLSARVARWYIFRAKNRTLGMYILEGLVN